MIGCIVVDDEKAILEELCVLIRNTDVQICGAFQEPYEALENVSILKPDAVFLDIEMPGMNGIELAKKISAIDSKIQIVFTTAYERYALQAFEVAAVHYILKPLTQAKVDTAIERINHVLTMNQSQGEIVGKPETVDYNGNGICDRIIVKERNNILIFKSDELIYVRSERGGTIIVTKKGSYKSRSGLNIWEDRLKDIGFVRCHRSFLVNSRYITRMIHILGDYKELVLDYCDVNIPISRQKVSKVMQVLGIS